MVEYILNNYHKPKTITLRQLDITANGNYRAQLRRVKNSGDNNILICSSIEALPEILKQAQQVGLLSSEHRIIITSLDMHTIDLEPFQYSGTNITGFRLVSPDDPFVKETTNFVGTSHLKNSSNRRTSGRNQQDSDDEENVEEIPEGLTAEKIQLHTALTFDAVLLFYKVLLNHQDMEIERIYCKDHESRFVNGTSIFNSMKTFPPFRGLSGDIQFDQHGNRENFQLEVLELTSEGLKQIGTWNSTMKIQTLKGKSLETFDGNENSIRNKSLIVMTVLVS